MINKLLLLAIAFVLSNPFYAQTNSNATVEGVVIDSEQGDPLEFVNIVVLRADSTFINGTTTDETGRFSIPNIPSEKMILKLSFLGYKNQYADLPSQTNRYALTKDSYGLQEVTIATTRPQHKLVDGNLLTNVENTLLSTIGTANDVMNQIPGVAVDGDKKIEVFGKGSPIVYINNRKVQDGNELASLQSADIVSVEVIRNPGAKYDAQTKSVVLIKTKRRQEGLSLTFTSLNWFKKHFATKENVDMTYSKGKWNIFGSYNFEHWASQTDFKLVNEMYGKQTFTQNINNQNPYHMNAHNFSLGGDYSFTDKQIVGVLYRGSYRSSSSSTVSQSDFLINNILDERVLGKGGLQEKPNRHLLNVFYDASFGDKFNLRLDADYVSNKEPVNQDINEKSTTPNGDALVKIESKSNGDLFAVKLTNTYKITGNTRFEVGGEYNKIEGNGFYHSHSNLNKIDNIYENEETKFAGFVGFFTSIKGWDVSAGLRYEYSREKNYEDSIRTLKFDRTYSDFYPNLSLSKVFGEVSFSLNGNIRTSRPPFSLLNSYNTYVNRFLREKGNPYLEKEDYYDLSVNLLYKQFWFNLGYTYVKNPLTPTIVPDEEVENGSTMFYTNSDKGQTINAVVSYNQRFGFWHPTITLAASKPFFSSIYKGELIHYNKPNYTIDFKNDLFLPSDFVLSLYLKHQSDVYGYSAKRLTYTIFNVQLRKSIMNDKLRFNLNVNDLFNSFRYITENQVGNYFDYNERIGESRNVNLTIQYFFNSTKKKYRGRNASDDINRL